MNTVQHLYGGDGMGINKVQNKIWNADHTQVTGYNTIVDLTDASPSTDETLKNIRRNVDVYLNDGEMYEGAMDEYGSHTVEVNQLAPMTDTLNGYVENLTWKLDDVNTAKIIPENLRAGVSILGVDGIIPVPSGTLAETITVNGTYTFDVSQYEYANILVNVSGGGGSMTTINGGRAIVVPGEEITTLTDVYILASAFTQLEQVATSQTPFDVRMKFDVYVDLSQYGMGEILTSYLICDVNNTDIDYTSGQTTPTRYTFGSSVGDMSTMHGPIVISMEAHSGGQTADCYWYLQTPAGMQVQTPTIHIEND